MKVIVITLSEALTTAVTLLQLFHLKPFFAAEWLVNEKTGKS